MLYSFFSLFFFFFNDTATTEIYTLSLHDALPISRSVVGKKAMLRRRSSSSGISYRFSLLAWPGSILFSIPSRPAANMRSEEHTSELQSQSNLVCRLLLEKKKKSKQR